MLNGKKSSNNSLEYGGTIPLELFMHGTRLQFGPLMNNGQTILEIFD